MLYTKTSKDEHKKLINYCKNCYWSGDYITDDNDKISVYKKNYTDDYVSHSIYTNPNIIYDNTLPRISNIKCINKNCVSNIKEQNTITIQIDSTISKEKEIIDNLEIKPIIDICKDFLQSNMISNPNIIKIAKNICVVNNLNSSDYKTLITLKNTTFNNSDINISSFTKKKNEIIFIKYNKLDLKYMYVCVHCRSSWKN